MANTVGSNVLEFLSSRMTLAMATVDENGAPNASYAPFVKRTPWLYVYTSARSKRTQNLTETTRASVTSAPRQCRLLQASEGTLDHGSIWPLSFSSHPSSSRSLFRYSYVGWDQLTTF